MKEKENNVFYKEVPSLIYVKGIVKVGLLFRDFYVVIQLLARSLNNKAVGLDFRFSTAESKGR